MYKHHRNVFKRFQKDISSRTKDIISLVNCAQNHTHKPWTSVNLEPKKFKLNIVQHWKNNPSKISYHHFILTQNLAHNFLGSKPTLMSKGAYINFLESWEVENKSIQKRIKHQLYFHMKAPKCFWFFTFMPLCQAENFTGITFTHSSYTLTAAKTILEIFNTYRL